MKHGVTAILLTLSAALVAPTASLFAPPTARADGLLFSYEGDTFPEDSGFGIADYCSPDCSRSLENGYFVLEWGTMGDVVNYSHQFASSSGPPLPPPTLWVEWQIRSNQPLPATNNSCDARFAVKYRAAFDSVQMFQDAVVNFEGGDFVLGLDPDIFHTYRYESLDGQNFTFAVDGVVFFTDVDTDPSEVAFIQFGGSGGCPGIRPQPVRNEWDFIRYGTIGSGEQIVTTDPPAGALGAVEGGALSSFTITFDQPAYLYVNDITVTTTGGTPPIVTATRRTDNGPSEVLEVVLHGPLPPGETTTFTFDTGTGPQSVSYFREQPEVPATSTWDLVLMLLLAMAMATVILRRTCLRESARAAGDRS